MSIDDSYTPAWPRLPWPEQHKWRYPMRSEWVEELARRLEAVWAQRGVQNTERGGLLLAARTISSINCSPQELPLSDYYAHNLKRAEKFLSAMEIKYLGKVSDDEIM